MRYVVNYGTYGTRHFDYLGAALYHAEARIRRDGLAVTLNGVPLTSPEDVAAFCAPNGPWPRHTANGRGMVWACCGEEDGPLCEHLQLPR